MARWRSELCFATTPACPPQKVVSAHVESGNGEGVILWGRHVFCNPVGGRFKTRWHQAGHYWQGFSDFRTYVRQRFDWP